MTTTKLVVRFKNEADQTHTWRYEKPNTSKTPAEIKNLLEQLTKLNLFEKQGIRQFVSVERAKFVTTKEATLF
ncbi:DUF2922 family protein [Enterococcus sp. AZ109]|uniref:DUF2922 family protein n=1 Tax=Enterococcus sp. AZ109 TaxID=2774634 RepID=UPI003F25147A